MSGISNNNIIELARNIATTHTAIGHVEGDKKNNRLFFFNAEQINSDTKSALNLNKLILGLTLTAKDNVSWNYKDTGTAVQKTKYVTLAVLGKVKPGDWAGENEVCQNAEAVIDDITEWLYKTAAGPDKCAWPVLDYLVMDSFQCGRVNNVSIAELAGAYMRITLRDWVRNSNTNPLNNMTNAGSS